MNERLKLECIICIYAIVNKINGKRYIGSTKNFIERSHTHKTLLKKAKHHSPYLQNSWIKYRKENFEFSILECVEEEAALLMREQWWLDNTNCEYNVLKIAGRVTGFKHSEETIEKLRDNQFKGIIGVDNPFSKKCYQYNLDGSFIRGWDCIMDIERDLGLSNSLIVRCLKSKTRTAHKFQWFYEYKGENIEAIILKSCWRHSRNYGKRIINLILKK